jgi:hypothetical protein
MGSFSQLSSIRSCHQTMALREQGRRIRVAAAESRGGDLELASGRLIVLHRGFEVRDLRIDSHAPWKICRMTHAFMAFSPGLAHQ